MELKIQNYNIIDGNFAKDIVQKHSKTECLKYERDLKRMLISEGIIDDEKDIEIRFLDNNNINDEDSFFLTTDKEDIVEFLREKEMFLNQDKAQPESIGLAYNIDEKNGLLKVANKTVNKGYTRGIPSLKYNLYADITYDTKTHVISKVFNRKFTITGVLLPAHAEDRTYKTTYSSTKKTCTVTCNYTDVSGVTTPIGNIEILRRNAYQRFKWSYSKGVYDGEGGYGHK